MSAESDKKQQSAGQKQGRSVGGSGEVTDGSLLSRDDRLVA